MALWGTVIAGLTFVSLILLAAIIVLFPPARLRQLRRLSRYLRHSRSIRTELTVIAQETPANL